MISISEESWPQAAGSRVMRALISIEADNPDSIRWYAREVLGLREGHGAWLDMERQLVPPARTRELVTQPESGHPAAPSRVMRRS